VAPPLQWSHDDDSRSPSAAAQRASPADFTTALALWTLNQGRKGSTIVELIISHKQSTRSPKAVLWSQANL